MALVLADRVRDTTTTTGTGTVTLSGTAVVGYQTFGAGVGNGNETYYTIAGQGTTEWEVGIGTYSSTGPTLTREAMVVTEGVRQDMQVVELVRANMVVTEAPRQAMKVTSAPRKDIQPGC